MTQCFAYSPKQIRCELEGGHSEEHSVQSTWSDEECYAPSTPATSSLIRKPAENPEGEPETKVVSKCVACGHAHRNGDCKCGCQGFIG